MAKQWVQISPYQAKVFVERNITISTLYLGIVALLSSALVGLIILFIALRFSLVDPLIQVIESKLLNGEPISGKVIVSLQIVFFCIIYIAMFVLCCQTNVVEDVLFFDLSQGNLIHIQRSLLAKLLKRPVSIKKRLHLSNYSQISLRVESDVDSDNDRYYFYSLVMVGNSPNHCFQIDCSDYRYYSLDRLNNGPDRTEFEHLGRNLASFLGIPMVLDIDANEAVKTNRRSGSKDEIETAVEKIYKTLKSCFGNTHEYRVVNSEEFRGYVDLAYYHRLQSALIEQGYTWAGDIEDMTVAEELQEYNSRTFIRIMINPTHNTSIGFYHVNPKIPLGFLAQIKAIDCETEFSPEKYLVTTNASRTPFDYPPGFDAVHLPHSTSYKNVLKTHYQRLQRAMSNWGLFPTALHSLEDVLAMQKRMQQAKVTYRKSIGYITQAELNRFDVGPEIAREVGRRLRERFGADS
ncbi:hypothetical protein [Gloeomargarita sp.]